MTLPTPNDTAEREVIDALAPFLGANRGERKPAKKRGPWTRLRERFGAKSPAPRANFFFRWIVPLVVLALGVATVALGLHAKNLVLNSRDGTIRTNVTDPSAPGFSAEVVPTPTFLVLETSKKGELVGVVLMSMAATDGGGTSLFFPSDLIVTLNTGDSTSLAKLYADSGPEVLRSTITRLIDADIDKQIDASSELLEALIAPVAPLQYTLRDPVRELQGNNTVTLLKAGQVSISTAEQIRAATEALGPGESTINRMARQVEFWQAWMAAIQAKGGAAAFPTTFADAPLVKWLGVMASRSTSVQQAKFNEATYKGLTLLTADVERIRAVTAQMIPYPQATEPGARLTVEVRNGVGDLGRNEPMNRKVVAAGGQVVVLGNANAFGVVKSSVTFYNEDDRAAVEKFADAIGVGAANVQFVDRPGSSIQATVTIGADFTP